MPKTITCENNKRNEILSAALELFLEKGYEKTSVRMISQKVGCEVGLVYYYFKTKEEVFENVLSSYFHQIEEEWKALTEKATTNAENNLHLFTDFVEEKAKKYREMFPTTVHFSIRCAICERMTNLAEIYLGEMLQKTDKKDSFAALFIARGVCGAVFREDASYWETNKEKIMESIKPLIAAKENASRKRDIPSFLL